MTWMSSLVGRTKKPVVECLSFDEYGECKEIGPGSKVRREDGKVYTVAKDNYMLIDDKGFLVCPGDLTRYRRQKAMKEIMKIAAYRRKKGI